MILCDEVKALQSLDLFAGMDPAKLRLLAYTSDRLSFSAGQDLFRQGDPGDTAFVIISGTVEIKKGNDIAMVKGAGSGCCDIVGEISMVTDHRRFATVTAVTPVEALRINRDCFMKVLAACPKSSAETIRALGEQLARAEGESDWRRRQPVH